MELHNVELARDLDIKLACAFSIMTVGLFTISWILPGIPLLTTSVGLGMSVAAFGSSMAIISHDDSIRKIRDYEK